MPPDNVLGFGAGDWIELALGALFILALAAWRPSVGAAVERFAAKTVWCLVLLVALPIALRLILLARHPAPTPDVYDEFSHLLVADTIRHLRLANPSHPFHRFFETFFVLQEPSYSSIYAVGPGLAMAVGWVIFGLPWAGVLLATGAFCALVYWMLRGWVTPGWALLGGLFAVMEFGPLNQWMNSYWGGSVAASAGCLVFGALPRLQDRGRTRDAVILGLGLGLHLLTRQFESVFLLLSVVLFFAKDWRYHGRAAAVAALALAPALALTAFHNHAVTGSWITIPEKLSQYQYGVPAALTFEPNAIAHRELTPQQAMDYKMQIAFRGAPKETLATYLSRLEYRIRYYRFFFLVPLYLALPFFLASIRRYSHAWIAFTPLVFALGVNFFPIFQFHYIAAVVCLFILMAILGLEKLPPFAARLLTLLCAFHFLFWFALHTADATALGYETWGSINHQNPERRIAVNGQLAAAPGKQLVFVRYSPRHIFQDEWVYNGADIDASRVVWARDLGVEENDKLRHYYPDRTAWVLEPDQKPPSLSPYPTEAPAPAPAPPAPKPLLHFEPIPLGQGNR